MSSIHLLVHITTASQKVTLKVDRETIVYDLCRDIRTKYAQANVGNLTDYGIFVPDEDPRKAYWLESARTISYYPLKDKAEVEYRFKYRRLRIRTLDDTRKVLQVDDSKTVAELMVTVCSKIGISNHEEYSLVHELEEEERMKTLTMKKGKSIAKDYDKLEKMKRDLHTDDDLNWLPHAKTLRQLGIDENTELLLRRKYFFSDQNVDSRDPVQLNLLYVQLKDAILDGAHPITLDEAIQLAAIQCQVEFGNHVPEKMKNIHIDLKDYLPKEYVKGVKGVEKKIFQQHSGFTGLSSTDAKGRYIHVCRSLKTYGITFFLVKEKIKGKNKLAPRLFGVSKESVMRVDEKTKEVMKTWPLTTLRRWAATANLFTLDFGEYSDSTYVMQTTDGEQIAQLISGYIDIILKKKKQKDYLGMEGDEECTMHEDNVAPARANIIEHQRMAAGQAVSQSSVALPGVVRMVGAGQGTYSEGSLTPGAQVVVRRGGGGAMGVAHVNQNPQQFQMRELSQPKRAAITRIGTNLKVIEEASEDLEKQVEITDLGQDTASKRWRQQTLGMARMSIASNLGAMGQAAGGLVNMISTEDVDGNQGEVDYGMMNGSITTIGLHVRHLMDNVRLACQLSDGNEDDSGELLKAARSLAGAFQALMQAAEPGEDGQDPSRKSILEAAGRVGEASRELVHVASAQEKAMEQEWAYMDELLTRAKLVANATAGLVVCSKRAASALTDDPETQTRLINSAKIAGIATSQLVTCAKVMALAVEQPASQQQLVGAAKQVSRAVDNVLLAAEPLTARNEELYGEVDDKSGAVQHAVQDLLEHIHEGTIESRQDPVIESFFSASERLPACVGDGPAMLRQAQPLAKASTQLVAALKLKGEQAGAQGDEVAQSKFFSAAMALADATARLVEAAKACSGENQHSLPYQQALAQAAQGLTHTVQTKAGEVIRERITDGLEFAGRAAAMSAGQLVVTSQEAAKKSRASNYQVCQDASDMSERVLPRIALACSEARSRPEDPICQSDLLQACQDLVQNYDQLLKSCQALAPTVRDEYLQSALSSSVHQSQSCLGELRRCVQRAEGSMQGGEGRSSGVEAVLDRIGRLAADLDTAAEAAAGGTLLPLPGDKVDECGARVGTAVRDLRTTLGQLVDCLATPGEGPEEQAEQRARAERLAGEVAEQMGVLVQGLRGLAAVEGGKPGSESNQAAVLQSAKGCAENCASLMSLLALALASSDSSASHGELQQACKSLTEALSSCLAHIPGHREVDHFSEKLTHRSHKLTITVTSRKRAEPPAGAEGKDFNELQAAFNQAASDFNQAVSELSTGGNATETEYTPVVSKMTIQLTRAYERLMDSGEALMATSGEEQEAQELGKGLQDVTNKSGGLMDLLRGLLTESDGGEAAQRRFRHGLLQAASDLSSSVNQLLLACATSAPPVQRQCEASLRHLDSLRAGLAEPPTHPRTSDSYFTCLDTIDELTKNLTQSMQTLPIVAKENNPNKFCDAVKDLSEATGKMITTAGQAAYLVGVSDRRSEPGRLAAQSVLPQVKEHQTAIHAAHEAIADTATVPDTEAREKANVIAKRAGAACQLSKQLVTESTNQAAKRRLVDAVKGVAQATSGLVSAVRGGSVHGSVSDDVDRAKWTQASGGVVRAVDGLVEVIGPEFQVQMAKIAPEAREAQQPIMTASQEVVNGADNLVRAAASLAAGPKSSTAQDTYESSSKVFADSVHHLYTTIKESSPGQAECQEAQEEITTLLSDLDQASMRNIDGATTAGVHGDKEQSCALQLMTTSLEQLTTLIPGLITAGTAQAERLGHGVGQMASYMQPLVQAAIKSTACLRRSKDQSQVIEQTKTVLEAASQMVTALQAAAGNPKSVSEHGEVEEAAKDVKDGCDELIALLNDISARQGAIDNIVENITKACAKLDEPPSGDTVDGAGQEQSFNELQTRLAQHARKLTTMAPDLLSTGEDRPLGPLASALQMEFGQLADATRDIQASLGGSPQHAARIMQATRALGEAIAGLVRFQLPEQSRLVNERVADLMSALQASACGSQACIRAVDQVSTVLADLETTGLFASSGTLSVEIAPVKGGSIAEAKFSDFQDPIVQRADALITNVHAVVTSASADQEELAQAASNCVISITSLSEIIKSGAASLGGEQTEAQVTLINAARDVANSLVGFLNFTKTTVGQNNENSRRHLTEHSESMVTSVRKLMKTVRTVEDETLRGTRALKSTLEAMSKEAQSLESWDPRGRTVSTGTEVSEGDEAGKVRLVGQELVPVEGYGYTPEDLVRVTKMLMTATSKAVTAGSSHKQEDVMLAANAGRKAVTDVIRQLCCTLSHHAHKRPGSSSLDEEDVAACGHANKAKEATEEAVQAVLELYRCLLQNVQEGKASPAKMQLKLASRRVAQAVHEISEAATVLKGSDLVDPSDPATVAEEELTGAAQQIEAAARKLAQLRPRNTVKRTKSVRKFSKGGVQVVEIETDEEMSFDDQILSAAKSIVAATAALVQHASVAQQELVTQGRIKPGSKVKDEDETQWSQGLISAARMVAAAVHNLCESANALMQGSAGMERLISSSKQIAASTAQLLVACMVKADPDSTSMRRLQVAGGAVKKATEALVKEAQEALNASSGAGGQDGQAGCQVEASGTINKSMVTSMRHIIQTQADILAKERELENLRAQLTVIRSEHVRTNPDLFDEENK